jgi:hypothetical protein
MWIVRLPIIRIVIQGSMCPLKKARVQIDLQPKLER